MTNLSQQSLINPDHLFKLRLLVARYGESDLAAWWNTDGLLGRNGAQLLATTLPRTHAFARARLLFKAIAQATLYWIDEPAYSLFQLPPHIEAAFDSRWARWRREPGKWIALMERLEETEPHSLATFWSDYGLLGAEEVEELRRKRLRAHHSIQPQQLDDFLIQELATGFIHGEPGRPILVYIRQADLGAQHYI